LWSCTPQHDEGGAGIPSSQGGARHTRPTAARSGPRARRFRRRRGGGKGRGSPCLTIAGRVPSARTPWSVGASKGAWSCASACPWCRRLSGRDQVRSGHRAVVTFVFGRQSNVRKGSGPIWTSSSVGAGPWSALDVQIGPDPFRTFLVRACLRAQKSQQSPELQRGGWR